MTDEGWFVAGDPAAPETTIASINDGGGSTPQPWPQQAIERGAVDNEEEYYKWLQSATIAATETAVSEQETADDQQLIHAVRSMDDCQQQANELAERVAEWGGSLLPETGSGESYLRTVANRDPATETESQLVGLAARGVGLFEQAETLREYIERQAQTVAPNLASLAGPVLAARLIALAGGLEELAKLPSSTVQVLGAEDALFAHLRGNAPSPKHGVIFTHEYVRGTHPAHRGTAARALAGKLTIAARVDYYSGSYKPEIQKELDDRIEVIREREA